MRTPDFLDPVTLKEIYGISRRGQTYVGRVLYVGVTALILYEFWRMNVAQTPFLSPSAYAKLGRELFKQFVPFQMLMVTIAAIVSSADRIIREDRAGTLGLLLLTPLTARRVLISKWKASMAQAGSLILCGLPVVAVCVYLGGVGPLDLLWCFSLTGAMALLGSAFGLRASTKHESVPRALIMAFLLMVGYALLPLTLVFVGGIGAFYVAPFLHPAYAAGVLLTERGSSSWVSAWCWIPATTASFFVSRWLIGRTVAPLEKRVHAPIRSSLASDSDEPVVPTALAPRGKKPAPERRSREVWEREPLLWKELLTRAGNRWTSEYKTLFLIYSVIFVVLCWLFSHGEKLEVFAFIGLLFSILATVNGASLFAPEKEGRKMDMLLSAPISSAEIIRSKLFAGLGSPESIRMGLLGIATAVAFSWWSGAGVILYVGVFILFTIFVFVLAAAASLHADSLQGAALGSLGLLSLIVLVLPIFVSILAPPSTVESSLPLPLFLLSSFDPIWVLRPLDANSGMTARDAVGRFLLFSTVYGISITGLVALLHLRFDRLMGRA
jgi:ABC-type transport system involved in multi-copper enzyme maturation permease subunit